GAWLVGWFLQAVLSVPLEAIFERALAKVTCEVRSLLGVTGSAKDRPRTSRGWRVALAVTGSAAIAALVVILGLTAVEVPLGHSLATPNERRTTFWTPKNPETHNHNGSAPTPLDEPAVVDSAASTLTIRFNEALSEPAPDAAQFTISIDSSESPLTQ